VGGDTWQLNRAVLRRGGAVALFGFAGGTRLVLDVPTEVIAAELRLFGFAASSRDLLPSRLSAFGDAVLPLLEAGYVAPVIADLLPFERVGEAYRAMAAREVAGKIVMVP
jgi:NADPH:quinone reductase-like Zn-dependent oxidoreductase